MADTLSKEDRSRVMSKVRSSGTQLEQTFIRVLHERGVDFFEEQPSDIIGHPDLVFRERKLAIFIDSCFWHGCPRHLRMPSSNQEYWKRKIGRNKQRDKNLRSTLRKSGWKTISIWEHELPNTPSLKRKITLIMKHVLNQAV